MSQRVSGTPLKSLLNVKSNRPERCDTLSSMKTAMIRTCSRVSEVGLQLNRHCARGVHVCTEPPHQADIAWHAWAFVASWSRKVLTRFIFHTLICFVRMKERASDCHTQPFAPWNIHHKYLSVRAVRWTLAGMDEKVALSFGPTHGN